MCLAVPGKILEVGEKDGCRTGRIDFAGIRREAYLDLVPEADVGDYVLVHVGVAITRIDEEEARKTFAVLEEMELLAGELGEDAGSGLQEPG